MSRRDGTAADVDEDAEDNRLGELVRRLDDRPHLHPSIRPKGIDEEGSNLGVGAVEVAPVANEAHYRPNDVIEEQLRVKGLQTITSNAPTNKPRANRALLELELFHEHVKGPMGGVLQLPLLGIGKEPHRPQRHLLVHLRSRRTRVHLTYRECPKAALSTFWAGG